MSRRWSWAIITLLLLLAAGLRSYALGEIPPGLSHDEVANWLITQDILGGNHAIYFTEAYGHEPLYQYVQAGTVALFGDNWLGLRWPSLAFGMLGLAAVYALMRRLFDGVVALLSMAWMAVSFWPLFYARVGLRAISLPFTAALSAYFLAPVFDRNADPTRRASTPGRSHQLVSALLSGLFLGLSLYTYMAARILPFIFVGFLVYSFAVASDRVTLRWSSILVFLLVTLAVTAPLVTWLAAHPGAEYRISEIREPLDRLLAGDPTLVCQNLVANLKSFTITGDPWPQQNLPDRPAFLDPIGAVLFYAGAALALKHWREPRYGLLLIWLIGALGPSVATSVAPNSIRSILELVVIFVLPASALTAGMRWFKARVENADKRVGSSRCLGLVVCCTLLAPCLFMTVRDYFIHWPRQEDVRYFYQAGLTAVARQLDEGESGVPTAVAGLSVHTMDSPTLELTASRGVKHVRLCDARETLVVPRASGAGGRLFVPEIVPFDDDLRDRLLSWGVEGATEERGVFVSYRLPDARAVERSLEHLQTKAALANGFPADLPASFGGHLAFLGYEWLERDGESVGLLTYWRVEDPPPARVKIFVHLLDESGERVAQDDGLGSPPQGWVRGDLIVQKHEIQYPESVDASLFVPQVGLYNVSSGSRLPVVGLGYLSLPPVQVRFP